VLPATPLLIAGHPGLDFLNTRYLQLPERTPVELVGDGRAFVDWLLAAGLLDRPVASRLKRRFGDALLDDVAAEARKFRQWASDWIERWRDEPLTGRDVDHGPELRRLNLILERTSGYRELVTGDAGFRLVEHTRVDSAGDLLAIVALQIALLVTTETPDLVKRCAGADCVLRFVDRTKAHRRVFCSAAVCGNRAKVAAFRARKREEK
jgi:hypothetical protein